MGLESATYIDELVASNPNGDTDNYSSVDDHLQLIKQVLLNSLPNVRGPVAASDVELSLLQGLLANAAELNILDGATITTAELNWLAGTTSAVQTQLDEKQPTAQKGQADGYCELDSSTLVPLSRIPGTLTGKSADQLDGQEGSFYQNAGNLNAGSLPLDRLPGTLTGKTAENAQEWLGASYTISTAAPSGGNDGDFWFQREA